MAEAMLRHPYPTVEKGGDLAWGGNQGWLKAPLAQKYGCGVVAATDLLLYLHRYGEGWGSGYFRDLPEGPIPWEIYDFYADRLRKRYFPLIPPFGLNTLLLAGGLNRYFREYQLPLRAGWRLAAGAFWQRAETMLRRDIPVILCIGPNFPFFWQKHQLPLYTQGAEGSFLAAGGTQAHFVTMAGMEGAWLTVSSWGRRYHIRREEYEGYCRKHSCPLYCGMAEIR